MRLLMLILALVLCAAPAVAGPFEDATAAYNKGDYATALRHFRLLAEQGNASAQVRLGLLYDAGRGVPQDYVQAASWYRKAAEQGDAEAQYYLGSAYNSGRGVPEDYVQAHKWFNLAAAQGDRIAIASRDLIATVMTPAQIADAQKLAREWKPKPAR